MSRDPTGAAGRLVRSNRDFSTANDSSALDDLELEASAIAIDDGPARAGWATAELSSRDALDSWQNMLPPNLKIPAPNAYMASRRAAGSREGSGECYDSLELAGEESGSHGNFAYESFSPLLHAPTWHASGREHRSHRHADHAISPQGHSLRPRNGESSRGRRVVAPSVPSANIIPPPMVHDATHMYGPVLDSFPRRQSGRVRAAAATTRDASSAASRPHSGAISRPPSGSGVYTIQPAPGIASTAVREQASTLALESARMDDVLDDYMQTYGVTRRWSGNGGNSRKLSASNAGNAGASRSHSGNLGQSNTPSVPSPSSDEGRRFSGLTIRGIRPR